MKKIFAIALALVMVLSMASAFATYCNWGAWDCATTSIKCGKATVEVVPYVRANTACGFEFAANNCAAAVVNENVYFAVKVTVDADVNEDWYKAATLSFKGTDVDTNGWTISAGLPAWNDAKDGGVFYLEQTNPATPADAQAFATNGAGWVEENADFTFGAKNVFSAKAAKSSAKICATLNSVWAIGTAKDANKVWSAANTSNTGLTIGKYWFGFMAGTGYAAAPGGVADKWILVQDKEKEVVIALDDDKVIGAYATLDKDAGTVNKAYFNSVNAAGQYTGVVDNGTIDKVNAKNILVQTAACNNEAALVAEVFDFLKIGFGTCMTDQGISNNFGWNDTQKSCTDYKKTGSVAVDAECVVAIPKTGDASVLAWLF